jgi:hypothetical protein
MTRQELLCNDQVAQARAKLGIATGIAAKLESAVAASHRTIVS